MNRRMFPSGSQPPAVPTISVVLHMVRDDVEYMMHFVTTDEHARDVAMTVLRQRYTVTLASEADWLAFDGEEQSTEVTPMTIAAMKSRALDVDP